MNSLKYILRFYQKTPFRCVEWTWVTGILILVFQNHLGLVLIHIFMVFSNHHHLSKYRTSCAKFCWRNSPKSPGLIGTNSESILVRQNTGHQTVFISSVVNFCMGRLSLPQFRDGSSLCYFVLGQGFWKLPRPCYHGSNHQMFGIFMVFIALRKFWRWYFLSFWIGRPERRKKLREKMHIGLKFIPIIFYLFFYFSPIFFPDRRLSRLFLFFYFSPIFRIEDYPD